MSLPVTNLDDRRFQDIVDEAKRLIPVYCPEWTNHNVSDPGVALIELFAWMTEMTLFRLNQVPDAFFSHLLNLVDFEPFPPSAATTDLTFWLVGPTEANVVVPAGTEVATTGDTGAPRVFATVHDLVITQAELTTAWHGDEAGRLADQGDVWDDLRVDLGKIAAFPIVDPTVEPLDTANRERPLAGQCLYLGFRSALAGNAIQLEVVADPEGRGVVPDDPPIVWEVWEGEGWVECRVFSDSTGGLNRNGNIVLLVPNQHSSLTLTGEPLYWLRARLYPRPDGEPYYTKSPVLKRLSAATIGGTVLAEHSEAFGEEWLGRSTGRPDQRFQISRSPLLPRRDDATEIVVTVHGDTTTKWEEVDDFSDSAPDALHVMWSSTTGEIRFGPLIRYPDGTTRQHGAVPPEGARVGVTGYRAGGGNNGNVGAGTLTTMRSAIPYVSHVVNAKAAIGGVDAESIDEAKRRAPQTLRAGARAVTVGDFERLAAEADPAVARARCVPPATPGTPIKLLIVPAVKKEPETHAIDDFALPRTLIRTVAEHLDERRVLGTTVEIATPYYKGVSVVAKVTPRKGRIAGTVEARAAQAITRFLNPLVGGVDGRGWPFEQSVDSGMIMQLLEGVDGVQDVDRVLLFEYDLRNDERMGVGRDIITLEPSSLFLSAAPRVVAEDA